MTFFSPPLLYFMLFFFIYHLSLSFSLSLFLSLSLSISLLYLSNLSKTNWYVVQSYDELYKYHEKPGLDMRLHERVDTPHHRSTSAIPFFPNVPIINL